jgi:Catalase
MKYALPSSLSLSLSAVALTMLTVTAAHADDHNYAPPASANAQDFIAVFKELNGVHPGIRKAHAKGVCAAGTFTPSAAANQRFDTALFDSGEVPVTLRFSMGGGNPEADERQGTRGVGIQFQLPDNKQHNIAGITSALFSGSTPNHFLGLLQWNLKIMRGEATREDIAKYIAANPSMQAAVDWNKGRMPSSEYTNADYYGIHAFWVAGEQQREKFRWQLLPSSGNDYLTQEEQKSLPTTFLAERLVERLEADGEVSFDWHWTIGAEEDPTNDPSVLWPEDRERVNVGKITITAAGGEDCTPINFDPMRVVRGIQPSDDPVLPMRSAAYAISFGQRLSNQ